MHRLDDGFLAGIPSNRIIDTIAIRQIWFDINDWRAIYHITADDMQPQTRLTVFNMRKFDH